MAEKVEPLARLNPYYQDDAVTLYHGDCRKILPTLSGDVLITSPPYGVQGNNMAERHKNKYGASPDILDRSLLDVVANANCRWKFLNIQALASNKAMLWQWVGENAARIKDVIIWEKSNPAPAMEPGVLDSSFEFIFCIGTEADCKRKFTGREWRGGVSNVLKSIASPNEFAKHHRAAFPLWLPRFFLGTFTEPGETVLEPFAGIGTTLLACKLDGRRCVGVELSERYCEIAANRLSQGVLF